MPLSWAESSICLRAMRVWYSVVAMVKISVTRMTASAGTTSAGAKAKICVTYISENRLVRPVFSAEDTSIWHRLCSCWLRLANSPLDHFLKKSAGRDRMRIIVAACTERFNFVVTRAESIALMLRSRIWLTDTLIMNVASATSSRTLPLTATCPKSNAVSLGVSRPTSDTRKVASATSTISARSMHCTM